MSPLKRFYRIFSILAAAFVIFSFQLAQAQASEWFWLSSDEKYTKYFEPDTVKVIRKAQTNHGDVPTELEGWTKTTYTFGGADETIRNYEIQSILPDPRLLSYSLALLRINPQNRTIQYAREDFYDPSGKIIWSKTDGRIKEINSQSFDEEFYTAIVDEVFRQGETKQRLSDNRWISLYTYTNPQGGTTTLTADTTTMRLRGANLVLWEWEETRDASNSVTMIKFMKKAVNISQGTERVMVADSKQWTPQLGWKPIVDDMNGAYKMIDPKSPEYSGMERLRAFVKGYSTWVNRYSLE